MRESVKLLSSVFRRPAKDGGFTLLEVMIAVAIIALSFVSLLGSQSQSISIAGLSRFTTTAALLARQRLAELGTTSFADVESGEGDFKDDFADFHWQTEVTELTEDETGIPDSGELIKQIDLRISRGDDENMVYSVRMLIMAPIHPSDTK